MKGFSRTFTEAFKTVFKVDPAAMSAPTELPRRPERMPSAVTRTPIIDLHTHTTYSDGSCSAMEIIQASAALRLRAVSITDHDTLSAYVEEQSIFHRAEDSGMELVPGVEVSCVDRNPLWRAYNGRWPPHVLLYFPRLPDERSVDQHVVRLAEVNAVLRPHRCWWPLAVLHILFTFKQEFPEAGLAARDFLRWLCRVNDASSIPNPDISWLESHPCEDFSFWIDRLTSDSLPGQVPPRMWDSQVVMYAAEKILKVSSLPHGISSAYELFHYVHRHADRYLGNPDDYQWYALATESVIEVAHQHNGMAVLAHPCGELQALGHVGFKKWITGLDFDGFEAYTTLNSGFECLFFAGLGGIQTVGSDFHGIGNPAIKLGFGKEGCHGMQTTKEQINTLLESGMLHPHVMDNVEWLPVPDV